MPESKDETIARLTRERDEWNQRAQDALEFVKKAIAQVEVLTQRYELDQARLATVPALVEAIETAGWTVNALSSKTIVELPREDFERIRKALAVLGEALAAYQETTK